MQSSGTIGYVETTSNSRAQILKSITDFLEGGPAPVKGGECRFCGAAMQFVEAHFLLTWSVVGRRVSLPLCPVCDWEILKRIPRPETIH